MTNVVRQKLLDIGFRRCGRCVPPHWRRVRTDLGGVGLSALTHDIRQHVQRTRTLIEICRQTVLKLYRFSVTLTLSIPRLYI